MSLSLFTKLLTTSRGIKSSGYNKEYNVDKIDEEGNYVKSDNEPSIVEPIVKNVITMDCSAYHTIYLLNDNSVWVSGDNSLGQIPFAESSETEVFLREITDNVNSLNNSGISDVYCGGYNTFLKFNDGKVYGCGLNDNRQVGCTSTDEIIRFPKIINISDKIEKIYCGGYHNFFITELGDTYCCGRNEWGQLGLGNYSKNKSITLNSNIKNINNSGIDYIRCGDDHTFFVFNDKNIKCCGYNGYFELGIPLNDENHEELVSPVLPNDISVEMIKDIQCGSHHTLILDILGNVYGTGQNEYGQLGLGDNVLDSNGIFRKINVSNIKNIITSAYTSIFQIDTVDLYGCGLNQHGELGMNDLVNRYSPIKLLYTNIWLDELAENIIIKPPADFKRNIFKQ